MVARARSRSCAFAHLRIAQQTYLAKNNDDYTTLRDPNRRSRASFDILLLITTSADSTTFMDSETEGQNDARQPYSKLDAGPAPRARRGLPSEGSFVGGSRKRLGTGTASAGTDVLLSLRLPACEGTCLHVEPAFWSANLRRIFGLLRRNRWRNLFPFDPRSFPSVEIGRNWPGDLGESPLLVGSRSSPHNHTVSILVQPTIASPNLVLTTLALHNIRGHTRSTVPSTIKILVRSELI